MFGLDRKKLVEDFRGVLKEHNLTTKQAAQVVERSEGTVRGWSSPKGDLPSVQTCCLIAGNFGLDILEYVIPKEPQGVAPDRVEAIIADRDGLKEALDKAGVENYTLSTKLDDALKVAKTLEEADKRHMQLIAEYDERVRELEARTKDLEAANEEIRSQREDYRSEAQSKRVENENLKRQNEALTRQVEQLGVTNAGLEIQIVDANDVIKVMANRIKEMEKPWWKRIISR